MAKNYRRLLAVLVLLGGSVGVFALSDESASADAGASPDVGTPDPVIVSGVILRNGSPATDATVTATLWPNEATLAAAPDDQIVPMRVIPTVPVLSNGSYQILLDAASVTPEYWSAENTLDLELYVTSGGKKERWFMTASKPSSSTAPWTGYQYWQRPGVNFEVGNNPAVTEAYYGASTWTDELGQPIGGSDVVPVDQGVAEPTGVGCGWAPTSTYQNGKREHFINIYAWSSGSVTLEETSSSSHTMGVAVNESASGGSYKQDGTSTIHAGFGGQQSGFADVSVSNLVNYRLWKYLCGGGVLARMYKPHNFGDIINNDSFAYAPHKTFSTCVTKYPNADGTASHWWKYAGSNVTYSTGVTLSFINLSAKSSFSTQTSITFDVKAKSRLCASSSQGWLNSAQAETHKY